MDTSLIDATLQAAVAIEYQKYVRWPELFDLNSKHVNEWADVIAAKADTIMYRSSDSGANFLILAKALTYLAIASPTGITFNGITYNLEKP